MLIESPKWTSSRMGPTSAIVAVNPLPPDDEVSMGVNADIVPMYSTAVRRLGGCLTNPGEHG